MVLYTQVRSYFTRLLVSRLQLLIQLSSKQIHSSISGWVNQNLTKRTEITVHDIVKRIKMQLKKRKKTQENVERLRKVPKH